MKKYIFLPLMCLMLMSSTCENDNNRHFEITFKNQSDSSVDLAERGTYDGRCALIPITVIEKNSVFQWRPFNASIERELGNSGILELFFVNNRQPQGFYDCDSIPIKNDILRHYQLTLKDLQRMNFTVTYTSTSSEQLAEL